MKEGREGNEGWMIMKKTRIGRGMKGGEEGR